MTEIKNIDELPLNSNSNGTYDFLNGSFRRRISKKEKEEENEFNLTISKKIESKNWKCRKNDLEE